MVTLNVLLHSKACIWYNFRIAPIMNANNNNQQQEDRTMESIAAQIRSFIVENFLFGSDQDLTDETSFLDEGIIDSTGVLELISFLEETFAIQVEDDELIPENLDSINNVTRLIYSKTEETTAA